MDFPITDLMDEEACYDRLVGLAPPRRARLPPLHDRGSHGRPPPPPRPGPRLSAAAHCRRVFNAFTGTAFHETHASPLGDPADPPRDRPGDLHGPAGPRAGSASAPSCCGCGTGSRPGRWRRPTPIAAGRRRGGRGRRDVPECRREKAFPTPTRGPAAAAGQQAAGPRHLRQRPARRWPAWSARDAGRLRRRW